MKCFNGIYEPFPHQSNSFREHTSAVELYKALIPLRIGSLCSYRKCRKKALAERAHDDHPALVATRRKKSKQKNCAGGLRTSQTLKSIRSFGSDCLTLLTMPPFVDHANPSAMATESATTDALSRSKSADDLMLLKHIANANASVGASRPEEAVRIRSAHVSSSNQKSIRNQVPTSMQWVGSYFFDQFSRLSAGGSNDVEDDLVVAQNGGDGDDSTVGAYFAESDFLPSNWTGAVEYIPPVGLAVVAGGLCFLNPIVFVGGILTACTALGAVHAAQTSYDTCIDGNLCQIFENDPKNSKHTAVSEGRDEENNEDGSTLKRELSEVTFNNPGMDDAISEVEPEILSPQSLVKSSSGGSRLPQDPSALETCEQALEWVKCFYPPLNCKNIENLEFTGLNALEIFDVFWSDDAPFTFSEFQKKRQDKNIRYGKWEDLTGVAQPSLVQAAAKICLPLPSGTTDETSTYHNNLKERVLHFQAKTNSGLFGPPYATTTKVQRCLVANKRLLVLESKTTLKDIPFCDRFYVLDRWLITSQKRDDQYVSTMSVSCQVVFSKGCPFEATILSKSQETVTEIALQWNEMAQKALEATEQARLERLKQDEKDSADATTCNEDSKKVLSSTYESSIEVERMSSTVSRIIGNTDDDSVSVLNEDKGKPPSIPIEACSKKGTRRRPPSMRRSLSRSLSSIMKRRRSNPL